MNVNKKASVSNLVLAICILVACFATLLMMNISSSGLEENLYPVIVAKDLFIQQEISELHYRDIAKESFLKTYFDYLKANEGAEGVLYSEKEGFIFEEDFIDKFRLNLVNQNAGVIPDFYQKAYAAVFDSDKELDLISELFVVSGEIELKVEDDGKKLFASRKFSPQIIFDVGQEFVYLEKVKKVLVECNNELVCVQESFVYFDVSKNKDYFEFKSKNLYFFQGDYNQIVFKISHV